MLETSFASSDATHQHHFLADWLQLHKGDFGFRTPTADEFRFATAIALLGGARGIGMWAAYRMNMTWAAETLPPLLTELGCLGRAAVSSDRARRSIVLPEPSLVMTTTDGQDASIVAALYANTSSSPLLLAVRTVISSSNSSVKFGGALLRGFISAKRVKLGKVQSTHNIIDGSFTDQMRGLDVAIYRLNPGPIKKGR